MSINLLGLEKLSDRTSKLCLNFARKCEKSPNYSNWFHTAEEFIPPSINTRSDKTILKTKYNRPLQDLLPDHKPPGLC